MKLSACIIAKNEEQHIRRCLHSIANVVDEIVLTDTGSTDRTVEYAGELGARINYFTWVDDFSAAYNDCIHQATGDWILLIDADEELLPESCREICDCIQRDDVLAYTLLRRDLVDVDDPSVYTKMLHFRLFRNRPDLRFIGRIHHQFINPLDEIAQRERLQVLAADIELNHYGYVDSDKRPKLMRAEKLMTLELKDRPDQFYYLVELGRTRIALEDQSGIELLHRAAEQVAASAEDIENCPGQLALLLEHLLACDVLPNGFSLSIAKADEIASRRFPNSVPLLWQRAQARFKSNCFDQCAELLESILELGRSGMYDKLASFNPDILGRDAILNLGVCYTRLGRVKEALRYFEQLTSDDKHGESARTNAQAIRRLLGKRLA